ncbi:hypothetical protein [Streptomyces sp. NBC_00878]|nr:hypothetical protein [Streptomyces sp. NBC_00878]MCX4907688.1 hypothetical protein [Streptomyces sp. NBC_00878]
MKPANILLAPDASGDPYARVLLTGPVSPYGEQVGLSEPVRVVGRGLR